MEEIALRLIPNLSNYPSLSILVACVFVLFFGSMIYGFFSSLFTWWFK